VSHHNDTASNLTCIPQCIAMFVFYTITSLNYYRPVYSRMADRYYWYITQARVDIHSNWKVWRICMCVHVILFICG